MVPEGSRLPRRGRVVRVVGGMFSSPSEVEVEVWLEESLGREVEGAAIAGTGVSGSVEIEGGEVVGPCWGDMVGLEADMLEFFGWGELG